MGTENCAHLLHKVWHLLYSVGRPSGLRLLDTLTFQKVFNVVPRMVGWGGEGQLFPKESTPLDTRSLLGMVGTETTLQTSRTLMSSFGRSHLNQR